MLKIHYYLLLKKIDDEPIIVDEAKPIATNSTEANRMVKEQSKINKEKAFEEYKNIGGKRNLTKDFGTKDINKNIQLIKKRNDKLKEFLKINNVSGYSKLNKESLIKKIEEIEL